MKNDIYKTLGVARDATPDELKQAYRKAAHASHPDKAGGSNEKFQAVTIAYQVLKDPERRQAYDQTGNIDDSGKPEDLALMVVAKLFSDLLQGAGRGIIYMDVFVEIDESLKLSIEQAEEKLQETRGLIIFLEDVKTRVGCTGDANPITGHLDGVIRTNNILIIEAEKEISTGKAARKRLPEFSFIKDVKSATSIITSYTYNPLS